MPAVLECGDDEMSVVSIVAGASLAKDAQSYFIYVKQMFVRKTLNILWRISYNFHDAEDEPNSVTRKLDMQNINNVNDLIAAAALALRSGDSLALTELMDVVENWSQTAEERCA